MDVTYSVLVFTFIKLVGYVIAASFINKRLNSSQSVIKIGFAKLLLGFVFGLFFSLVVMGLEILNVSLKDEYFVFSYFLILLPIRAVEWNMLFHIFYSGQLDTSQKFKWILAGVLWSSVLDLPAGMGLIFSGDFIKC